jgi:hypothetical protein
MSLNSHSGEQQRERPCVELLVLWGRSAIEVSVASIVSDAASTSEPNVRAVGRTSKESAVDQRPHHGNTRFAIDAQQSLGLWHRDAESWHFGVLGLNPAG